MHIIGSLRRHLLIVLTICATEIIAFAVSPTLLKAQENAAKPVQTAVPAANTPATAGVKPNNALDNNAEKQFVKVTIATSRPEVTRNHAWGLTADVRNTSSEQITILAKEVSLVMQPEATQDTQCFAAYESFLPNTTSSPQTASSQQTDSQITLQPGEHYMFFWSGVDLVTENASACQLGRFGKLAETLNFIPGPYTFAVVGKLHSLRDSSGGYHTFAEAVAVRLGIEQLTIMLFAGIGAILAYLVVALQTDGDVDKLRSASEPRLRVTASLAILRNIGSAFLLGAVLAIVANRLSDTQFPVKVSVNDVWGALTVGFVFYFIGNKLIDKLKTLGPSPTPLANPGPNPNPGDGR
jgi:hypothetical protein